jgi:hypothetical protein
VVAGFCPPFFTASPHEKIIKLKKTKKMNLKGEILLIIIFELD